MVPRSNPRTYAYVPISVLSLICLDVLALSAQSRITMADESIENVSGMCSNGFVYEIEVDRHILFLSAGIESCIDSFTSVFVFCHFSHFSTSSTLPVDIDNREIIFLAPHEVILHHIRLLDSGCLLHHHSPGNCHPCIIGGLEWPPHLKINYAKRLEQGLRP